MLFESESLQLQLSYGIAELRFLAPANWRNLVRDLSASLSLIERNRNIDVLIVRELASLPRRDDACSVCREGQRLTNRIASLQFPTIAYINGPCRGPALELALSCTWRAATGHIGTRFGANGIACWGSTARLPRLIRKTSALALLAGTAILTATQAYEIGLIDRVWSPRFAEVGLLSLSLDLQENPGRSSNWIRTFRTWRSHSLPTPSEVQTWLYRAVDRGLRFGSEEALVVERAAAHAFLANQAAIVRRAA